MGISLTRKRWTSGLAAALVLLAGWASGVAAQEACREDSIALRGDWGMARFTVEIARTPEEQSRGLMHRAQMPVSAGMLFVYDSPRSLSFWMRNTLIPLDMLFIDARGVVQRVHHNAVPLDETSIFGGDNLTSVLEINGGLAKRLGITEGSAVRHPSVAPAQAAWPC